ncbi:Nif3-like dinuclear metal center hexameric protein [Staphylospora marina]|uniref:Nif3-like dinuclear metal center hexameric protein n=1 Tax=Staphylospora marina TaxID=2490858 RepID=UPI000F5C21C4|nr:Nif3-like dinuclear metal center hexameric protein [Staphylospora marina]
MSVRGTEVIRVMERWAPPGLAVEKDRIGLQIGDPASEVKGILVTLDVDEKVAEEAVRLGANWIVAHHAPLWMPLKEIRIDKPVGRLMARLIKNDLNVFVSHTNLDSADDGVNDVLAERLGLLETKVLIPYREDPLKKLVVFVPEDHHEKVLNAVSEAGAGWIGNYSHCTFNVEGTGTFMPGEGTNPFIGKRGTLEKVREVRLETVFPASIRDRVVKAMLAAHPYEEVAYDIYPLDLPGTPQGYGRIGRLPEEMTLEQFASHVRNRLGVDGLRMVGDPARIVKKVAVLGGAGGRNYPDALRAGADVYVTGDVDYHTAQDALRHGLALVDPGHHVERWVVDRVVQRLKEELKDAVPVHASTVNTDPFRFVG